MTLKLSLFVATLAAAGLLVNEAQAAPGDVEIVSTANVSGGAPLVNVPLIFGPPTITNIPGVVQAGLFSFGPITGQYYYFPASRSTVLSGTFSSGGQSATITGQVSGDLPGAAGSFFGPVTVQGFGALDGAHVGVSP